VYSYTEDSDLLVPGFEYELEITGICGEGLCCEFGEGHVGIYTLVGNEETFLFESYGEYGLE
jgi:hypothetical protein